MPVAIEKLHSFFLHILKNRALQTAQISVCKPFVQLRIELSVHAAPPLEAVVGKVCVRRSRQRRGSRKQQRVQPEPCHAPRTQQLVQQRAGQQHQRNGRAAVDQLPQHAP